MDIEKLADDLFEEVKAFLARGLASVTSRLQEVEDRLKNLPVPKDGTSITLDDARPVVVEAVREAVAALPAPKDGTSVTVEEVLPPVLEAMRAAIAELPPAKDGTSVTLDDLAPLIADAAQALPRIRGEAGRDGASIELADVLPTLQQQVAAHLESLPVPQDGKSVTVGEVVQALLPALQTTLDGALAKWALDFERRAQETLQRACAAIPKPKDGDNGRDALAVDQFAAEVDEDGRTIVLTLGAGDQKKEARLQFPTVLDRGVFKDGDSYARGDAVTWAGSLWIAQKDAPEGKPDTSRDWRLSVKRGRDGKDGVVRNSGPQGPVKL